MIELDYSSRSVDSEITNILYPSALTVNQSNGDIFVRGFSSASNGVIYWMNKSGSIIDMLTYPDTFSSSAYSLQRNINSSYVLPYPSTMDFDHVRGRLWWTANDMVYMADVNSLQISNFDLSNYGLQEISPIEVEYSTGNVLIGCYPSGSKITGDKRFSTIVYMFKDNNYPIEIMDVADSVASEILDPQTQPDIETGQSTPWPLKLEFDGFNLGGMNGTWERSESYRGQIHSYICPNNTINLQENRKVGFYGIGSYILHVSGEYAWQFIFYTISDYPIIDRKWIYRKEIEDKKPTGKYILTSYYSYDKTISNEYDGDFGTVTIG